MAPYPWFLWSLRQSAAQDRLPNEDRKPGTLSEVDRLLGVGDGFFF